MRLFIAIKFPDHIKSLLLDQIADLKQKSVSGNFTKADNLHLTLAFIGETTNLVSVKDAVNRALGSDTHCFGITIGGNGRFGNLWWAGIERNEYLKTLAESIRRELRINGFNIEKREFSPHITLAREVVPDSIITLSQIHGTMMAEQISLMRSDRIAGKLTYTSVFDWQLND